MSMSLRVCTSSAPSPPSHHRPSKTRSDIGLIGLSTMGKNLVYNLADHGFDVSVYNRSPDKTLACVNEAGVQGLGNRVQGHDSYASFVGSLDVPRKVILLVKAGEAVDRVIEQLVDHLEEGDIVIDGGNEWYELTEKRERDLAGAGIRYVGMGVSGGAEGARNGPSLMVGCEEGTYEDIQPFVEAICAKECEGGCVSRVGPGGSGNYVKMVHNGIEYGIMQCISEVYALMRDVYCLDTSQIAEIFAEWNEGKLKGFLTEITARVCNERDPRKDTGYLIDSVLSKGGMKGTGTWTAREALAIGVPVPTISASVDARVISCLRRPGDRHPSSKVSVHAKEWNASVKATMENTLRGALLVCYAQGLHVLEEKGRLEGWELDLPSIVNTWRGGCIIRMDLLDDVERATRSRPEGKEPIVTEENMLFCLESCVEAWEEAVCVGHESGIPVAALASAIAYYHSWTAGDLPMNLIQAQRDAFGNHGFERKDEPGVFYHDWIH